MQAKTIKMQYSWEQIFRFMHSHKNYKVRPQTPIGWDMNYHYDENDWMIYNPELDCFMIFNFEEQQFWIMEMSVDYFSKDIAMFHAEPINKLEKEFVDDSVKELLGESDIPAKNKKSKTIYLRDVKPGQKFYFVSDMNRDTCVSYGKLPSGRYSVVNMRESPDSNYGEFPGESEVCLVEGE